MHSEIVQGVTVLCSPIRLYSPFASVTFQLDDLSFINMKSIHAVISFILRLM